MAITNPDLMDGFDLNNTNSSEPSASLQSDGYADLEIPLAENHNFMFKQLYRGLQFQKQTGAWQWDVNLIYPQSAITMRSGSLYTSQTDNNTGNDPLTDETNWKKFYQFENTGFKNLIINGLLSRPINQRGAASITDTPNDYNYDRWFYDGTYLYYGVEDNDIYDDTFTLSWLSDATAEYQLITTATASSGLSATTTGWTSVSSGDNFTLASTSGNNLWLRFTVGLDGFSALDKVQLEQGSIATPFEQRPIGLELELCKRYFERIYGNGDTLIVMYARATNQTEGTITYSNKRDIPTITPNLTLNLLGISGESFSSFSISAGINSANIAWVDTGTPFTPSVTSVGIGGSTSAYIDIDAGL